MDKPKIELRRIKHSKSLSEETAAYTAEIWVDGAFFCAVSNHGQGGPDMHYPPKGVTNAAFQPLLAALDARVKETFPKCDVSDLYREPTGSRFFDMTLETVCGQLLADNEFAQMLKRDLKRKVLFQKPGSDAIWTAKLPPRPEQRDQMIQAVKDAHKIARTLNEIPFHEALVIYSTAGE